MSELRKDPISGRWVIIATERSKRPDDFRPARGVGEAPASAGFCPFCRGNEGKTPPEVFALRDDGTPADSPGWRVRVVPNKFPALNRGTQASLHTRGGIFEWMEGVGVHEVIIENPEHGQELADLPVGHVRDILGVFAQRIKTIEEELHYQYVQVFKNKGKEAGASLSHPHTQIVATPIVPKRIEEEIYGARRLFRSFKKCVFCRIIREERESGERVVHLNRHFVVIAPYASRFPFEVTIFPLRHSPFFADLNEEELGSLALTLKTTLIKLKETLSDPAYNLVLHKSPNPVLARKRWPDIDRHYHWHFEIFPILTKVAGFEWGTGYYINPVPPETAAGFLRKK